MHRDSPKSSTVHQPPKRHFCQIELSKLLDNHNSFTEDFGLNIVLGIDSDLEYRHALEALKRMQFGEKQLVPIKADGRAAIPYSHPHAHLLPGATSLKGAYRTKDVLTEASSGTPFAYLAYGEIGLERGGGVRCLFATDHSNYSNTVFERFLEMEPRGIEHLTVFTAIEPDCRMAVANLHRHLADGYAQIYDAHALSTLSDGLVERSCDRGISSSKRLRTGHVIHLIEEAMEETGSELLILGAQGQGASEGQRIGSTASTIAHSRQNFGCLVIGV